MKRRRRNQKREKAVLFLSSLFVLTALTMTGLYVKGQKQEAEEEYMVDLSNLEGETNSLDPIPPVHQAANEDLPGGNSALVTSDEVQNPEKEETVFPWEMSEAAGEKEVQESHAEEVPIPEPETAVEPEETEPLTFKEEEGLNWPVVGNVLINYSMEKPVYFASLQQYKVSPAIVIQAAAGQQITAAVRGRIEKIVKEEETGNTIYMDVGSGYEVTYGQLTNMQVKEGDLVEKGAYLADVAEPTRYYSIEGPNVYFALSKDGRPVDPMGKLN